MTVSLHDNRKHIMTNAKKLATARQRGGPGAVLRQDVLRLPLMDIVDTVLELLPLVDIEQMVVTRPERRLPCTWCGVSMIVKTGNKSYCTEKCRREARDEWGSA